MAATAEVRAYHSVFPGTPAVVTSVRFKRADTDTADQVGSIVLPSSGENLTWRKMFKVNWTTTPTTLIANLRFFTTSPVAGIKHYAKTTATYVAASAADESGIASFTDNQGNKDTYDELNHTSGAPLTVNSGSVLANPSTGEGSQDFVLTQVGVLSTYAGVAGATTSATMTYRYQET